MTPVGPAPVRELVRTAPHLVVLSVPMGVLRAGRRVCLVAQRLPPAVAAVRWVDARRSSPAATCGPERSPAQRPRSSRDPSSVKSPTAGTNSQS